LCDCPALVSDEFGYFHCRFTVLSESFAISAPVCDLFGFLIVAKAWFYRVREDKTRMYFYELFLGY
jgi:hypothetical protein